MSKKRSDYERLKERWHQAQELSGGPFRISAINRHRQFALLHAAAKARATGNVAAARGALSQSTAARTDQWLNSVSPMELIERRGKTRNVAPGEVRAVQSEPNAPDKGSPFPQRSVSFLSVDIARLVQSGTGTDELV
jgi:hypothetical protein